jgi:6,7-dimethyl-8-ribityllumazine synthase
MVIAQHMNSARCTFSTAVVALFLGPLCCNRQDQATHPLSKSATQLSKITPAPAGIKSAATEAISSSVAKIASNKQDTTEQWLIGSDERPIPVVGNLEQHLIRAEEAQKSRNNLLVASELRAAARVLQPERSTTIEPVKADVLAAAKNLNQLATQAEAGKTNVQILTKASITAYDADLQHGVFTMQNDQWLKTYRQPITHFVAARAALPRDPKLAIAELRKAKAYVDIDAARTSGTFHMPLSAKSLEIGSLVSQVAAGKVKESKDIDHVAAETAQALTDVFYHNAKDAWQKHDAVTSAQWLTATIYNLQQAMSEAGTNIDSNGANILTAAENFAEGIRNNKNVDAREMDKQLDQTGAEMRKLIAIVHATTDKSAKVATLTHPSSSQSPTTRHD